MSLLDIRPYDRGLWLGDSKTQGDTWGTQTPVPGIAPVIKWHLPLAQAMQTAFLAAKKVPPVMITSGVMGDTAGTIIGGIVNRCYQFCPDWVVIECDTNDASNPTSNAQFTIDVNTLTTDVTTAANYPTKRAPRWVLWVSANALGEKHPDGANAFDTTATGINAKAAILAAQLAAYPTVTYWNPRPPTLAWETANNPGNFGSGLLFTALDGAGKHEVMLGGQAMASWMLNNTFQGIPAGLPQFPLFTLVTS